MIFYKSRDWLYYYYWLVGMSTIRIAYLCNVSHETIRLWMHRLNIPFRSQSDSMYLSRGNHVNLSKEALQFIDGELLGDGCLSKPNSISACLKYSVKYSEYAEYLSREYNSFGIKQSGRIRSYFHKDFGNISYHYASKNYIELLLVYERWYPNGKKRIPQDLKLSSIICKEWYIGDGSNGSGIYLYTCTFLKEEVEFLIEKLRTLGFLTNYHKSTNSIYISEKSKKEFLDYIGQCPISCYEYKWQ